MATLIIITQTTAQTNAKMINHAPLVQNGIVDLRNNKSNSACKGYHISVSPPARLPRNLSHMWRSRHNRGESQNVAYALHNDHPQTALAKQPTLLFCPQHPSPHFKQLFAFHTA